MLPRVDSQGPSARMVRRHAPITRAAAPQRLAGRAATALVAVTLAACGTVPFDYPRDESEARPPSAETYLGRHLAVWETRHPGKSGFVPLSDGLDALGARLRLMERAEHTIDAQYFLIKDDAAGALFAGKLLRAADRGVRVRLLLDDVFTPDLDAELSLLDAHPNIEVRMFNPLPRQGMRAVGFLVDFKRANRRMHNKSFTVDNAATIIGGRNIAEEYFQIDTDVEFADYEVFAFGPVATKVSETFDLFWNSPRAVPIEAFGADVDLSGLDDARIRMNAEVDGAGTGIYAQAVNSTYLDDVAEDRVKPFVATARVVTDDPSKLESAPGESDHALISELDAVARDARSEVIIFTPYFVPGDAGVEYLSALRERGIRVVVVTNSLASTNHVAVHSGYFYRREPLLRAGVELYEVKADALRGEGAPEGSQGQRLTMHSKLVVVDNQTVFVGSLNFDPRSIDINTEMGVFIDSPEAAMAITDPLPETLARYTYRLALGDAGLEWHYEGGSEPVVETSEPGAGFGRNFAVGFFQLLPIESQL